MQKKQQVINDANNNNNEKAKKTKKCRTWFEKGVGRRRKLFFFSFPKVSPQR